MLSPWRINTSFFIASAFCEFTGLETGRDGPNYPGIDRQTDSAAAVELGKISGYRKWPTASRVLPTAPAFWATGIAIVVAPTTFSPMVEFLSQNWMLVALFVVSGVMLFMPAVGGLGARQAAPWRRRV